MLAQHWKESGKSRPEGTVAEEEEETPDIVGSFGICQEVNWEEVVGVMALRRGKAPDPVSVNVNIILCMVVVGW